MVFYKILLLTTVACLVQLTIGERNGEYKKVMSVTTNTTVTDGHDEPVFQIIVNLNVYGNHDKFTDQDALANIISGKVSLLARKPAESLQEIYVDQSSLPLMMNLTVNELIYSGPKPVKKFWIDYSLDVYAKKKKHQEAISLLRTLKTL